MVALESRTGEEHDDGPRHITFRRPVPGAALTRPAVALPQPILRLINDRRIRYLFTGGIAAAVFYSTFAGVWLLVGDIIAYLVVVVFASLVTALTTYPIYRALVFDSRGPWLSGFAKFYVVSLWGLVFNLIALPFLVEIVHLHVLIAQAIVLVGGPLLNYQLHRRWTFRPGRTEPTVAAEPQRLPAND